MTFRYVVDTWLATPDSWGVVATYMLVLYLVNLLVSIFARPDGR